MMTMTDHVVVDCPVAVVVAWKMKDGRHDDDVDTYSKGNEMVDYYSIVRRVHALTLNFYYYLLLMLQQCHL